MGLHLTISRHFQIAFWWPFHAEPELVVGPLQFYLGWNSAGLVWDGRFDFIIEKSCYRPEGRRLFETWKESQDTTGGYLFGRIWRLMDLRTSARGYQ